MLRFGIPLAVMMIEALIIAPCIQANDFWTKDSLSKSSWNSVYADSNGNQVNAQIKFRGDHGVYDTARRQGKLFDIEYGVDKESNPGKPFFQINGKWSFQGKSGEFLFASDGRDAFKGNWYGDAGSKAWNGTTMYGGWQKDPNTNRMFCEYRYPAKGNSTMIHVQYVIWYPNDIDRSGYFYFANKEKKIWGRCVCPGNPSYDPRTMQWSKLIDDSWYELPKGD